MISQSVNQSIHFYLRLNAFASNEANMLHFCMLRTEALTKMDNSLRFRSLRRNYETHRARILLEHRARAKSAVAAGADSLKQRRVSAEAAVPQRSGRRYKVDGTSGAMTKEAFASLASLGPGIPLHSFQPFLLLR